MCLHAARLLNQTPSSLAQRVIEIAQSQIEGEVSAERGYINIRGPRTLSWLNKVEHPINRLDQDSVVIVARCSDLATIRLLARACLQIKLNPRNTQLLLFSALQIERLNFDAKRWYDQWRQQSKSALQRQSITSADANFSPADWSTKCSANNRVTVWVDSSCVRSPILRSALAHLRGQGLNLNLAVTPTRWGSNATHESNALLGSEDSLDNLARLLYLASDLLGAELDPAVPSLNERANPLSNLRSTCLRLGELNRGAANISGNQLVTSELVSNILLRCRFMPLFVSNASDFGEVGELMAVLDDLCRSFQRYFNQPEIRQRLRSAHADAELGLVISGVQDTLAYILTIFEDESSAGQAQVVS